MEIIEDSPSTITREWGQRRITITCNVRGRDLGSFVAGSREEIARQSRDAVARYHLEFGGQFEHLISAQNRLMIVVPIAVLLILRLALSDLRQRRRHDSRLHRRPVRCGRRHLRPVAPRHAVLDLGGDRLHRHVRRRGPRRHDPRLLHPATSQQGTAPGRSGASKRRSPGCGPC